MKLRSILSGWKLYLLIITIFAILIRSIPTWFYSAWGTDFGIYYSITIEFLDKKNPFYEYPAVWGSSGYGSFPMLYTIILIAHTFTGLPPQKLLLLVPPIIGGLCVVPLYFIAYEVTANRKIALLSAILLAINPIHMFQTSMPYLLTVGHLFMLISMYFFIKWLKDDRYIWYLIPSSIALLLSHHLTNYMFIISLVGITFFGGIYGYISKPIAKKSFFFIIPFTIITIAYWILRVPGMPSFISSPFHHLFPWYVIAAMGIGFLFLLYFITMKISLTPKHTLFKKLERMKNSAIFVISLSISMGILIAIAVVALHGYYIPPISIIYSIPFMLTMGFMGVGLTKLYKYHDSFYLLGSWLLTIVISMIVGLITWSSLEPWRHIEYLMEPLSIIGALGIYIIFKSDVFKKVSVKRRILVTLGSPIYGISHRLSAEHSLGFEGAIPVAPGEVLREPVTYEEVYPVGKNMRIIFTFTLVFIILMTGITAYPFMNEVHHPEYPGISSVVMSGIEWLNHNGNRNYTVAADHTVGSIIAAYGFISSFEYNYMIWNATNWTECLWELEGMNNTYPPIGYVVITKSMYEQGVYGFNESHNPLEPPVIMGEKGYAKFKKEPFKLIFRNSTDDESDWVEIYKVDWNYIENYFSNQNSTKNNEKSYTPWYSHRDFLNFSISCSKEFSLSLFTSIPAIFIMNSRDFR